MLHLAPQFLLAASIALLTTAAGPVETAVELEAPVALSSIVQEPGPKPQAKCAEERAAHDAAAAVVDFWLDQADAAQKQIDTYCPHSVILCDKALAAKEYATSKVAENLPAYLAALAALLECLGVDELPQDGFSVAGQTREELLHAMPTPQSFLPLPAGTVLLPLNS